MTYLLDTSVIVSYLRGRLSAAGQDGLLARFEQGCAVSTITVAEYAEGAYRSSRAEYNLRLWQEICTRAGIDTLPVDDELALVYGRLQAALAKDGRRLGSLDGLIAATAQLHGLILVTQDRDFRHIPKLRVELVPEP